MGQLEQRAAVAVHGLAGLVQVLFFWAHRTEELKLIRRLYDWVLRWAESPYGVWALFVLAFAESSFFPIPPDVLLIALCLGKPARALMFGSVSLLGSVTGGMLGYYIGTALMKTVGQPIIEFYGAEHIFLELQTTFNENSVIAILIAAITPIPYKVFTITAGVCDTPLGTFVMASLVGRGVRFFAVAGLITAFGPKIQSFIDHYFNKLAWTFGVLLVGGFVLIKILL